MKSAKFWFSFYFISFCFVYYQILSFKSDIAVTLAKRHSANSRGTKKVSQLSIPFRLNEWNRQKFLLNHSLIFHGVKQYLLKALNFGSHFISFHFVSFIIKFCRSSLILQLLRLKDIWPRVVAPKKYHSFLFHSGLMNETGRNFC